MAGIKFVHTPPNNKAECARRMLSVRSQAGETHWWNDSKWWLTLRERIPLRIEIPGPSRVKSPARFHQFGLFSLPQFLFTNFPFCFWSHLTIMNTLYQVMEETQHHGESDTTVTTMLGLQMCPLLVSSNSVEFSTPKAIRQSTSCFLRSICLITAANRKVNPAFWEAQSRICPLVERYTFWSAGLTFGSMG